MGNSCTWFEFNDYGLHFGATIRIKLPQPPVFLTFHRLAKPKCHLSPFENLILVREYVRNKNGLLTEENIGENIFPRGGSVDCPRGNVSSCCTSSVSCSLISIRSSIPYHESVIWIQSRRLPQTAERTLHGNRINSRRDGKSNFRDCISTTRQRARGY